MNSEPFLSSVRRVQGDARDAARLLEARRVDAIVCSPPYWKKRDYGHPSQLGQENTPEAFAKALADVLETWIPILKPRASVLLNLGDSRRGNVLIPVTTLFECEIRRRGWQLIARIVWAKTGGMPSPRGRLASRHEFIFHLARTPKPFVDAFAYGREFPPGEGDVWPIALRPSKSAHLAPFPEELARRALLLTCPERVCSACEEPLVRRLIRGLELDETRPQARRALKKWRASKLTDAHLDAIRATGLNDAGKSLRFHSGAGKNVEEVKRLAQEAKLALGGYFREFVGTKFGDEGFEACACGASNWQSGLALDPFCGSGTTLRAAQKLGRRALGIDLMLDENVES